MASFFHKKGTLALAAILACFALAYRMAHAETPMSTSMAAIGLGVLFGLPLAAIVLSILDIRDVLASRRIPGARDYGGYWQAVLALALAVSIIGTVGFYGVSHYLRNAAAVETVSSPRAWIQFTSADGDFTAQFPIGPTETTETISRPEGPSTVRTVIAELSSGEGYVVMASQAPNDEPSTKLDALEADVVKRSAGNLVKSTEVSAGSVPGRELHIVTDKNALRARLFTWRGHVYELVVIRPLSVAPADERDDHFLGSFTLVGS